MKQPCQEFENQEKQLPYQICSRCIMDTTDPEISFDENQHCNHCQDYLVRANSELEKFQDKDALSKIIKKIKKNGRSKKYDCVLGISGGVDSSYVAFLASQLHLRVLAVHFDNGWNSELAVANIKKIVDRLELDFYSYVVDWEEFKDIQIAFLKASVPNCEIPTDHAINALLFQVASSYGIKYIINGSNLATEGIMPQCWGYSNQDYVHMKDIHQKFGKKKMKTLPVMEPWKLFYYVFIKRIKILRILNYVDYNKKQATEILINKLAWRPYPQKHHESIYTRFFQGYILPKKFGYDKRRAHYSSLICSGEMSRNEAICKMHEPAYNSDLLESDMDFVLKKFRMSKTQFSSIMNMTPKKYESYKNLSLFFSPDSAVRNFIKKIIVSVQ